MQPIATFRRASGRRADARAELLEGDGGAGLFELSLRLLGVFLRSLLEDGLGRAVDEVLGLLQAETRDDGPDLLDDLDLLVAGGLEDDVELVLLLGTRGGFAAATSCRGRRHRDGRRRGHAELLFERLEEV